MPEDVPCDLCKVAHQDTIDTVEKLKQNKTHIGLKIIQQRKLHVQFGLAQYRLDLASVKGTCLLCRAVGEQWDPGFSTCAH